mgnify:CR=1 FL=1
MNSIIIVLIVAIIACTSAFRPALSRPAGLKVSRAILTPLAMSDEEEAPAPAPVVMNDGDYETQESKMFDMNNRVRLGRSRDQDGKSNIWSIEPTMEVEEEEEGGQTKKNLLIAGGVIGAAIACLPLFSAFSKLFPDPADF